MPEKGRTKHWELPRYKPLMKEMFAEVDRVAHWSPEIKRWLYWDGNCWRQDRNEQGVFQVIKDVVIGYTDSLTARQALTRHLMNKLKDKYEAKFRPVGQNQGAIDRFYSKVEKTDGCWIWRGAISRGVYGSFRTEDGNTFPAHRYSYELATRERLDPGTRIYQYCLTRLCVQPDHWGTVDPSALDRRSLMLTEQDRPDSSPTRYYRNRIGDHVPGRFGDRGQRVPCDDCV